MPASFVVYIDESGDEGFGPKSREWFLMSAVIASKAVDRDIPVLVKEIKDKIGKKPGDELHFANLEHKRRLAVVNKIAESKLHAATVLIHKPSILDPKPLKGGRRLYLQMATLLMEQISTYCCEQYHHGSFGDGSAEVIFAQRQETKETQIREHFECIQKQGTASGFHIDWAKIKIDQVYVRPYRIRLGLQLADAVCGSFRAAVTVDYDCVDDGYAIKLKPIVYSSGGKHMGSGIRLWPESLDAMVQDNSHCGWLVQHYGV